MMISLHTANFAWPHDGGRYEVDVLLDNDGTVEHCTYVTSPTDKAPINLELVALLKAGEIPIVPRPEQALDIEPEPVPLKPAGPEVPDDGGPADAH